MKPTEEWFWCVSFAEIVDNPQRKEVVKSALDVEEHPDGHLTLKGGALKVVHGVTQGRIRRSSFAEGVLVLVDGVFLEDSVLQVPQYQTFKGLEQKGHERDRPPGPGVGIVVLSHLGDKDGLAGAPELRNVI